MTLSNSKKDSLIKKYNSLPPLARIAEIESIRDGKGEYHVAYPEGHTQVAKINRQIETIRKKVKNEH
jgi:hypothetical protein